MLDNDCVFCNIINRTLASDNIVFESDDILVLKDIMPKAPVHLLVIPKEHILSINELSDSQTALVGKMALTARDMALQQNIAETGYKLIFNVGKHGNQTIKHLHLHLIGGKQLSE